MKKCFICFDTGNVKYEKNEMGNVYDYYAYCICEAGISFKGTSKKVSIPCIDKIFDFNTLKKINLENRKIFAGQEGETKDEIFGFSQVKTDEIDKAVKL